MSLHSSGESSLPPPMVSPQPKRPLKRKLFDQYVDTVDNTERLPKRYCASFPPLFTFPPFYNIEPLGRSRSDSFLDSTMSSRPSRSTRRPSRFNENPPSSAQMRTPLSDPPSPPSSFASLPSVSAARTAFTTLTPDSSVQRVKGPTYRHDLALNFIVIDPVDYDSTVVSAANDIFSKMRTSPGISEQQAIQAKDTLKILRGESDEGTLKDGFLETGIFPGVIPLPGIAKGGNIMFDSRNLPHQPLAPPLPRPKPKQHYCFAYDQFSPEETFKQSNSILQPSAAPSTTGFWPFLVVEFKSQAKQGTHWTGENQAAGGGAVCVNGMEKLLSIASESATPIQSIAFSCVVDRKHANLWVHYLEKLSGYYISVEVKSYYLNAHQDIILCRNSLRNILDWAIETRLPAIHDKLASIALPDLDAKHKQQRTRSLEER